MTSTLQQLRSIADKIEAFPRFIRRDGGRISVRDKIEQILQRYNVHNDDLLQELDEMTRQYRDTIKEYYIGQFL